MRKFTLSVHLKCSFLSRRDQNWNELLRKDRRKYRSIQTQFFLQFFIATAFGALKYLSGHCSTSSHVLLNFKPHRMISGIVMWVRRGEGCILWDVTLFSKVPYTCIRAWPSCVSVQQMKPHYKATRPHDITFRLTVVFLATAMRHLRVRTGLQYIWPYCPSHSVHRLRKTMIDLRVISHRSRSNCRHPKYKAVMLATALCVCWYDYSLEQSAMPVVPGQVSKHVLFKCNRHVSLSLTFPYCLLQTSNYCSIWTVLK